MFFLINCPFGEKDEAKSAGARWHGSERRWFVPKKLYHKIETFNKWKPNGRMYLNCPFSEKDQVKSKGARFDGEVRKWYFVPGPTSKEKDFVKWLPFSALCTASAKKAKKAEMKKSKTPPAKYVATVGKTAASTPTLVQASSTPEQMNAQMNAVYQMNNFTPGGMGNSNSTPQMNIPMNMNAVIPPWMIQNVSNSTTQINHLMNPAAMPWMNQMQMNQMQMNQMQMNQNMASQMNNPMNNPAALQWMSQNMENNLSQMNNPMNNPAALQWMSQNMGNIPSQMNNPMNHVASAASAIADENNSNKRKNMQAVEDEQVKKKCHQDIINAGSMGMLQESQLLQSSQPQLRLLPRITASLKKAQLSHELLHRDSSVTGTSNKKKQWFLDRLGLGSVWTSSPQCKGLDTDSIPKVSMDLTIAQLSHELLERNPTQNDMSGKNKEWFIEKLCIGSLWITGSGSCSGNNNGIEDSSAGKVSSGNKVEDAATKNTNQSSVKTEVVISSSIGMVKNSPKMESEANTIVDDGQVAAVRALNSTAETLLVPKTEIKWTMKRENGNTTVATPSSSLSNDSKVKVNETAASNADNVSACPDAVHSVSAIVSEVKKVKAEDAATKNTNQSSVKTEVVISSSIGMVKNSPKMESEANTIVDDGQVAAVRALNSTAETLLVPKTEIKWTMKRENGNTTVATPSSSLSNDSKVKVNETAASNAENVSACPDAVHSASAIVSKVKKEQQKQAIDESNGGLSISCTSAKNLEENKPAGSKAPTESTPIDAIPCVSSSMPVPQVKAECKAINPSVQGLSELNKTNGSELEASLELRLKAEGEEQKLHVFTTRCQPHALAKTFEDV